jgi:catecholate siderophore receptor
MESTRPQREEFYGLRQIQLNATCIGLMKVMVLAAGAAAHAQDANSGTNAPAQLPEVVVSGQQDSYRPDRLENPRFTEPVRDIPQTITVIPQAVIQEQNATTLRDVLRNVPGISIQAGEGGGGAWG